MFTSNFTFSSKKCSRVTAQHSDNWLENIYKKKHYPGGGCNSKYTNVRTVNSFFWRAEEVKHWSW